jgi:hypothetical protein
VVTIGVCWLNITKLNILPNEYLSTPLCEAGTLFLIKCDLKFRQNWSSGFGNTTNLRTETAFKV